MPPTYRFRERSKSQPAISQRRVSFTRFPPHKTFTKCIYSHPGLYRESTLSDFDGATI